MSQSPESSSSWRCLFPVEENDDEDFDNAPNVLPNEGITTIDEGIDWVVCFCDKTMAENKDRKMSSEEDLKLDDSESDIHPAFRRSATAGEVPVRFQREAGKFAETSNSPAMHEISTKVNVQSGTTIIGPRLKKTRSPTHDDRHRNFETDSGNPRSVRHTLSFEDARSIHEEGKAEFNKARSRSTGNRRRCGMAREVIGRLDSMQRSLNPPPPRPLPPTPPTSSSARIGRTDHTLPPLRPVSPLTFVDYDHDGSALPFFSYSRACGQMAGRVAPLFYR